MYVIYLSDLHSDNKYRMLCLKISGKERHVEGIMCIECNSCSPYL